MSIGATPRLGTQVVSVRLLPSVCSMVYIEDMSPFSDV